MTNMEDLKQYLDKTMEVFGFNGSDIHLWLENQPRHRDMTLPDALKLRNKVIDRFGHIYGEETAWSIALLHIFMDLEPSKKEVIILERQGDILVPKIKKEKDLIEEIQNVKRKPKGN